MQIICVMTDWRVRGLCVYVCVYAVEVSSIYARHIKIPPYNHPYDVNGRYFATRGMWKWV